MVQVPQESLEALKRAVKDLDQPDGPKPAIDEPSSVGETVCDGGGETDNDVVSKHFRISGLHGQYIHIVCMLASCINGTFK